jgi:MSHA pilin protein MshC
MIARIKNVRGFTLIELIMVMSIVGILAVVVVPRFNDVQVFQSRGFSDQVQASLRYAQKTAIAQRRLVCAAYTTGPDRLTLTITVTASCDTALNLPAGNVNYVDAPSGVAFSMTPGSVNFDALGRPNAAAVATVGNTTITVEAETGYVHQ